MSTILLAALLALGEVPPDEPIGGRAITELSSIEGRTVNSLRSPQNWALEFRFGPYYPDIDKEFAARSAPTRPFADVYGTGSSFLFSMELDYQLWHGFGSLALGGSFGYTSKSAKAIIPGSNPVMRSAADETSFTLLPLALLGIYRFDVLAVKWDIPLVPTFKLGLAYDLWWWDGGSGATLGYIWAAGGMILLDHLDPSTSVEADGDIGLNHTYIFFEYYKAAVNGLGMSNKLRVGDSTWVAGLAFEF